MMKLKSFFLVSAMLIPGACGGSNLWASDTLRNKSFFEFSASYIVGAQVYNDNFLYNPGFAVSLVHNYAVAKDVELGLGAGYMQLDYERFIPLFAELTGFKKNPDNTPLIKVRAGYSPGWSREFLNQLNYTMKGGAFVEFGIGRQLKAGDFCYATFYGSYRHQFAGLSYTSFDTLVQKEVLNYDMLLLGVIFKLKR